MNHYNNHSNDIMTALIIIEFTNKWQESTSTSVHESNRGDEKKQ